MVGERALPDDIDTAGAQAPEKSLGIANAGEGVNPLAAQCRNRVLIRLELCTQHEAALRANAGTNVFRSGPLADNHQRIGARKLRRQWRSQRPRRQHTPVTNPAIAVDHDQ